MPVGPIGSVWAADTWSDTTWEIGTWGQAQAAVPIPNMTRARGVLVTGASSAHGLRVGNASMATNVRVS